MKHTTCLLFLLVVSGCTEAAEAERVSLPVRVDPSQTLPVTTDLGYEVTLTSARVALSDAVFTIAGELHTGTSQRSPLLDISNLFIPNAHAHPGHYQGGDVTGELRGDFVVDWISGDKRELGTSVLIASQYSAANFTFARATSSQVVDNDPMLGHTALFEGVAKKDGREIAFTIVVDSPEDRALVGALFPKKVTPSTSGSILFRLHTTDPVEDDTLFDGIDFLTLDGDQDNIVRIAPDDAASQDTYNLFRRAFQSHDHYSFGFEETP